MNSNNRSTVHKLTTKFPSLYILLKINKIGLKNTLLNIKGYKSIKKNNLFDFGYYLKNNDDVRLSGKDPLLHYIYYGYKEGRQPNSEFNNKFYLNKYEDVRKSNLNPMVHYSLFGLNEDRKTNLTELENKFKVSIVMPTYNREYIIKRAINSIINQTFLNYELIICDDGSTDGTEKLLKKDYKHYFESGKFIFLKQKHTGVSKARNTCLERSSGNLIAYLDTDNYWNSEFLEKMVNLFTNSKYNSAYSALKLHNQVKNSQFVLDKQYDRNEILRRNQIDLNTFVHRRKLYERFGGFDESLNRLVDWDLILRYTKNSSPKFLNEILVQYYINESFNNITLNGSYIEYRDMIYDKHSNEIIDFALSEGNLITDPFFTRQYIQSKNTIKNSLEDPNCLIIGVFMEGELESLKSDPYLRLYGPLKHLSLEKGFKTFVYNIQKYKTKDVNKILNDKLFDVIIIQKEVVGFETSKMLLKKCKENDIEVIFELDDNLLEERIKELHNITQNFKISIILPVYNMEKYLGKTLESIEVQTIGLENLEVIMVNEASSDGSKSIIDEYSNKYENFIAVHLSESSGTPGKPRNIGMEMARGEYIMFIDHDDFYSDDACEVLYNKISKEGADIVSGIYNFVHGSEIKELKAERNDKRIFKNQTEIKVKNIAEKEELLTLPPVVWSKIFRRSFIEDNFLNFPVGVLAEDLIFLSNALLKAEGIIFLNQAIYNYRILDKKGETSLSHAHNKEWFKGVCDARKTIWDTYQKEGKEKYFRLICQYSLKYLLNVFARSNMEFDDKYEVLDYMYWIFKKSDDYGLLPSKEFVYLFKLILKKDYKNAIMISEILRNYNLI